MSIDDFMIGEYIVSILSKVPWMMYVVLFTVFVMGVCLILFKSSQKKRLNNIFFLFILEYIVLLFQNKKDRVEVFYQEAEMNFTYSEELNRTFDRVLGFLGSMAQDLSHSRWRNKTDFYTLFYALSKKQTILPTDDEGINRVKTALINFSNNVNEFLELDNDNTDVFPQYIKDYAKGVRAATDYSARTNRQNALDGYLSDYIG